MNKMERRAAMQEMQKVAGRIEKTDRDIRQEKEARQRQREQRKQERLQMQRRRELIVKTAAAAAGLALCAGAVFGIHSLLADHKSEAANANKGEKVQIVTQTRTPEQTQLPMEESTEEKSESFADKTEESAEAYASEELQLQTTTTTQPANAATASVITHDAANETTAAAGSGANETITEAATDAIASPSPDIAAAVSSETKSSQIVDPSGIVIPDWITVELIHPNEISRPQIALDAVNDIAIHYVGNAGSTAQGNRDYFDSLDNPEVEGAGRKASAHLIVGLDGEIIQCLPLNELAYAVKSRNHDTISIEVCHPDESGKFSDVTYAALVKLTAWLLQQENLTPDHVIRHYDCNENEKACPKYYVEHEDAWEQLKQDIADYYYAHPNIQ